MIYKQIIKLFNRESAFRLMMFKSRILSKLRVTRAIIRFNHKPKEALRKEVMGISFNGPVGLGPGLDRNGELYNVFTDYGFSFVDVGPMNATTVKGAIKHVQKYPIDRDTTLSVCIEKEHATAFSLAYDFMDMFVLDIPDEDIIETLGQVLDIRLTYETYKPVLLKLPHDLPGKELERILDFCLLNGVDGLVVAKLENVRLVSELTKRRIAIIGYGGIRSGEAASEMLSAGADLIMITTGLVMDGPSIVSKILKYLNDIPAKA